MVSADGLTREIPTVDTEAVQSANVQYLTDLKLIEAPEQ
jgi:hypothetical protein